MPKPEPVVFHAAIRQTQNALSLGSNGDGAILQLELPESELGVFSELMKLRRTVLLVTVMRADDVKGQSLLSPASPQDGDEKSNSGQPERKNGAPTKRKAKPEKGPYGKFWQAVIARNLFSSPDLMEWLEWKSQDLALGWPTDANHVIRTAFNVTSRTYISPEAFLAKMAIDLPEQAYARLKITVERIVDELAPHKGGVAGGAG